MRERDVVTAQLIYSRVRSPQVPANQVELSTTFDLHVCQSHCDLDTGEQSTYEGITVQKLYKRVLSL